MDQTQVAQIIQRLAAGEQIPGWSYHPEQTTLHGDSQYAHTEPTSAFFNGQGYWADGDPMRNQTLDLKEVAKLAAIMGTAYLGGTALAGSGSAAGSSGLLSPDLGSTIAASASDAVPSTLMGSGGMDAAVAASASGSSGSSLGNMASNAMNWMKANPTAGRLLMSGASGLLSASGGSSGGSSGGYRDSGYRPTITRGNWNPNPQARQMQPQPTLLNLPTTGNANSGLWRYGLLGG
jgi:hypothetical protein